MVTRELFIFLEGNEIKKKRKYRNRSDEIQEFLDLQRRAKKYLLAFHQHTDSQ